MEGASEFEGCTTHGPWGGSQGHKWVYMPLGFIKMIEITVNHGTIVNSICFQTNGSKGEAQRSSFGGPKSGHESTICIDYPNEWLMSISGTTGTLNGVFDVDVVTSICFMTNLKLYGPYGCVRGSDTFFSYDVKDGAIVGFHGLVRNYITAIGVYAMPKSLASAPCSTYESKVKNELSSSMSKSAMPRDAGPWGACGGKPWDDGVFSTVKQVRVQLGDLNVIYALQFEYLKMNGQSILSQVHGGTDGVNKIQVVKFDVKDECLTGISGFCGSVEGYNGLEAIVSITFHTNARIHGPYGDERGEGYVYFSSTASPGKVVGFHGRNNGFLSAIGVHMEYF